MGETQGRMGKNETSIDKQTRFIERVDRTESPRYQGGIRKAELATRGRVSIAAFIVYLK